MKTQNNARKLNSNFVRQIVTLMEFVTVHGQFIRHYEGVLHNAFSYFRTFISNNNKILNQVQSESIINRTDIILMYALASLHLALKVNGVGISAEKFSEIFLQIFKRERSQMKEYRNNKDSPDCCKAFPESFLIHNLCPILRYFKHDILYRINAFKGKSFDPNIFPKLIQYLSNGIIYCEKDLIYVLDFNCEIKSPFDYLYEYIKHIMRWHVSIEQNQIFKEVSEDIDKESRFILKLVLSHELFFYEKPPQIVALTAIAKAFDIYGIELGSSYPENSPKWFEFLYPCDTNNELSDSIEFAFKNFFLNNLNPDYNTEEAVHHYEEARLQYLESYSFERKTFSIQTDPNLFANWVFLPIEPMKSGEPMNLEPPPLELLESISGDKDMYNVLSRVIAPDVPPPDLNLILDYDFLYSLPHSDQKVNQPKTTEIIKVIDYSKTKEFFDQIDTTLVTEIDKNALTEVASRIVSRKYQIWTDSFSIQQEVSDSSFEDFDYIEPIPEEQETNKEMEEMKKQTPNDNSTTEKDENEIQDEVNIGNSDKSVENESNDEEIGENSNTEDGYEYQYEYEYEYEYVDESEETDEQNVTHSPVKRRGRPAGRKNNEKYIESHSNSSIVLRERKQPQKEIEEPIVNKVPGKRGRKPKQSIETQPVKRGRKPKSVEVEIEEKPQPARRGRPPKNPVIEEKPQPARRGRPPKNPVVEEVQEQPVKRGRKPKNAVIEEKEEPVKRGRKPKNSVIEENEQPVKRGRPPKNQVIEENEQPVKRGRPPKNQVIEPNENDKEEEKPKRGRSKKNSTIENKQENEVKPVAKRGRKPKEVVESQEPEQKEPVKRGRKPQVSTKAEEEPKIPAKRGRKSKEPEPEEKTIEQSSSSTSETASSESESETESTSESSDETTENIKSKPKPTAKPKVVEKPAEPVKPRSRKDVAHAKSAFIKMKEKEQKNDFILNFWNRTPNKVEEPEEPKEEEKKPIEVEQQAKQQEIKVIKKPSSPFRPRTDKPVLLKMPSSNKRKLNFGEKVKEANSEQKTVQPDLNNQTKPIEYEVDTNFSQDLTYNIPSQSGMMVSKPVALKPVTSNDSKEPTENQMNYSIDNRQNQLYSGNDWMRSNPNMMNYNFYGNGNDWMRQSDNYSNENKSKINESINYSTGQRQYAADINQYYQHMQYPQQFNTDSLWENYKKQYSERISAMTPEELQEARKWFENELQKQTRSGYYMPTATYNATPIQDGNNSDDNDSNSDSSHRRHSSHRHHRTSSPGNETSSPAHGNKFSGYKFGEHGKEDDSRNRNESIKRDNQIPNRRMQSPSRSDSQQNSRYTKYDSSQRKQFQDDQKRSTYDDERKPNRQDDQKRSYHDDERRPRQDDERKTNENRQDGQKRSHFDDDRRPNRQDDQKRPYHDDDKRPRQDDQKRSHFDDDKRSRQDDERKPNRQDDQKRSYHDDDRRQNRQDDERRPRQGDERRQSRQDDEKRSRSDDQKRSYYNDERRQNRQEEQKRSTYDDERRQNRQEDQKRSYHDDERRPRQDDDRRQNRQDDQKRPYYDDERRQRQDQNRSFHDDQRRYQEKYRK